MAELTIDPKRAVSEFTFVAFDFETTGLHAASDRVVEFGAVRFQLGRELATFQQLVNPGIPIHPQAASVNGINDEMVSNMPKIGAVLPEFMHFVGDALLIAHNAEFDVAFLRAELQRTGMPTVTNPIIDTQRLAQRAFPGKKSYALQSLVEMLAIPPDTAHRAVQDARQSMIVFQRCVEALAFMGDLTIGEVLT